MAEASRYSHALSVRCHQRVTPPQRISGEERFRKTSSHLRHCCLLGVKISRPPGRHAFRAMTSPGARLQRATGLVLSRNPGNYLVERAQRIPACFSASVRCPWRFPRPGRMVCRASSNEDPTRSSDRRSPQSWSPLSLALGQLQLDQGGLVKGCSPLSGGGRTFGPIRGGSTAPSLKAVRAGTCSIPASSMARKWRWPEVRTSIRRGCAAPRRARGFAILSIARSHSARFVVPDVSLLMGSWAGE